MDRFLSKLDIEKISIFLLVISIGISVAFVLNGYIEMKYISLPHIKSEIKKEVKKVNRSYTDMIYVFKAPEGNKTNILKNETEESNQKPLTLKIKDIKLIGVLNFNREKIALIKKDKKSSFIKKGDNVEGYKVVEISDFYLILEKNGKKFSLYLDLGSGTIKSSKVYEKRKVKEPVQKDGEVIRIDRRFVEEKTADIGTLLKDVLIVPVIRNNETVGFRFRYVKPQSLLYKFGLRSGDLIISINDMPVRTAEEAFKIYNMLRNEQFIKLVIERNGKRKVITYEIR